MLLNYVAWDQSRGVAGRGIAVGQAAQLPPPPSGMTWIAIAGDCRTTTLALVNGVRTEVALPLPAAVALPVAQAARWKDAKAYRELRKDAGCATALGRVQTDDASRLAIRDAAAEASANLVKLPAWSVTWTMADNSNVAHSAAQMVAMAAAVRTYINGCQAASQLIRPRIFAATTVAAVAAIDITAGYPA